MERIKELFFVILPVSFLLLIAWAMSSISDAFKWEAVGGLVFLVTLGQILLYIKNPKNIAKPVLGWIIAGTFYVFLCSSEIVGQCRYLLEFMEMVSFAFTIFFVLVPACYEKRK